MSEDYNELALKHLKALEKSFYDNYEEAQSLGLNAFGYLVYKKLLEETFKRIPE